MITTYRIDRWLFQVVVIAAAWAVTICPGCHRDDREEIPGETYQLGMESGVRVEEYSSGEKKCQYHLEDGWRHGRFEGWHRDGTVAATGNYIRGAREGRWDYWSEDGHFRLRQEYSEGRTVSYHQWYPSGTCRVMTEPINGKSGLLLYTFFDVDGRVVSLGAMDEDSREGEWRYWDGDGVLDSALSGMYVRNRRVSGIGDAANDSDQPPTVLAPRRPE